FRGRPNAPYMVNYTVRGMAEILDADLEELCRRIWENSERVYGQF
ncbi:TatD family hydrolase, partial [Streptomyces sp. tea 10]|nr:TatD family hydrolase [Streptomyces sp. tea 10]